MVAGTAANLARCATRYFHRVGVLGKIGDGGWATKTSLGMPVVEATGWIARFLARARRRPPRAPPPAGP